MVLLLWLLLTVQLVDDPLEGAVDDSLQAALEQIDATLGRELGISELDRRCGIYDVTGSRLALVHGDSMMYGASVPKIGILLGYFETCPEACSDLDPMVERELMLMIKQSSNEMAAKYSRLVGIERLAEIYQMPRYRLYNPSLGGGIWSGKHYGHDSPRFGDPLKDLSHAATARQILRYYHMLETGKLVSPPVSEQMRAIFSAPLLDFHPEGFVKGLRNRNVGVWRKNGVWEDWYLDSARISRDGQTYLLAGLVHHPEGLRYLERLATEVDELMSEGESTKMPAHRFWEEVGSFDVKAEMTFGPFESDRLFNEAMPSWNVDVPDGQGFRVDIRVGHQFDDSWSPWLAIGSFGGMLPDEREAVDFEGGRVDIDVFRSGSRYDRSELRIRVTNPKKGSGKGVRVQRIALCVSDMTGLPVDRPDPVLADPDLESLPSRLDVPFRSQRDEREELAARICSPVSVAMVMQFLGTDVPTEEVAATLFDPEHNIYGNWSRAVQGAHIFGVQGYLRRFSDWSEVARTLRSGSPLIVSIAAKKGELAGSPYEETNGHLFVICGFDSEGNVEVNDPAARSASEGMAVYRRSDLEKVWMERGGTAYVLLPP